MVLLVGGSRAVQTSLSFGALALRSASPRSLTSAVPESSERFHRLLDVQDHDTAIDQLLHRRANLTERSELRAVEGQIASIESKEARGRRRA